MLLLAALLLNLPDVGASPVRGASEDRALQDVEPNPETLEELVSEQLAVLEGDMILPSSRNAVNKIWPTHQIPYVISPDLVGRTNDILSAVLMVSDHTCVSFHQRTSEPDYLLFKRAKGCASYVGFIGGEQPVFVGAPCIVGNIVHEVLHALGFHHEHTRTDRGQFIKILPYNIMEGMERNFRKLQGKTFDLPYDISSIMHYGSWFFSANGLPTIVSNVEVKDMGQRVKMTQRDVDRVRRLYSCNSTEEQPKNETVSVPKEEKDASTPKPPRDEALGKSNGDEPSPTSANERDDHTNTTASVSAMLQQLDDTTRGRRNTSRVSV